jgi:methylthioribose-1-phosphate isomerase
MDFMSWYGFVQDYIQAFQNKRALGISNDGHQSYDPLESNSKDAPKLSIPNKYIETTLDTSKETFAEAINLRSANHYNDECSINAFSDRYEHTLMKYSKRSILTRIKLTTMMGKTEQDFIQQRATIQTWNL